MRSKLLLYFLVGWLGLLSVLGPLHRHWSPLFASHRLAWKKDHPKNPKNSLAVCLLCLLFERSPLFQFFDTLLLQPLLKVFLPPLISISFFPLILLPSIPQRGPP